MSDHMEKNVEAIVLKVDGPGEEEGIMEDAVVMVEYFSNLRLLIIKFIKNANISRSLCRLSNELRYVEWSYYPFKYFPSSFQPIHLVELILVHSSIKQLWKGKKNLPNLRYLCLRDSKNLIEIPNFEEFPNLEQLNLEGCESLVKLDSSIGLLRKIVYLNLKRCRSLISIPNIIFGMSSLKYINMKWCSKASFNDHSLQSTTSTSSNAPHCIIGNCSPLPKYPVYWLNCLSEIDISFCGLSQLPDAIGCLCQLQSLNLEGNYFVSLPSLNEFSKLIYLNLNHCKFLESLPQLPFPTAINWDLYRYHLNVGLNIFNCPKLGERECRIAFSWLKQFIQANPQCPHVIHILIPGSEIPTWFNNQSEGDKILIDYSPIKHDINNHIIRGLLCCSLFSVEPNYYPIEIRIILHLTGFYLDGPVNKFPPRDHQNHDPVVYGDLIKVKTNHIWLTYFPRKLSWYVPDIHGTMDVKFDYHDFCGIRNEVKNCGYGWLLEQSGYDMNL
ncbi:hypothetical protein P8452_37082 [Trifolium repens]|nr:hypothetical protein P8452_37082 [Trifolium repens]